MQNAPLPSVNASKAANLPKVNTNPGAGSSNDAFKQALSQQLEQRQTMKNAETRTAERQATAKPARQEQPIDHSAPSKPAEHATRASNADQKDTPKSANNDVNERAASDAEAAHAADPVADMLALVAAFNQRTDASAASADADAALAGAGGTAASAVDAATLAALTAAEACTNTAEQLPDTEFQAALGRAADTLPAASSADAEAPLTAGSADTETLPAADSADTDTPPAAGSADAASTPIPLRAELAGDAAPAKHAQGTSRPAVDAKTDASADPATASATPHAPGTALPPKVEAGSFGQQLVTAGARADAHAEADAALAAKDAASATPATLAAAGAAPGANAPELSRVATPATTLYSRVGTPAWDQQLGQKVIFMAAGGEQSATMELNPPDLGSLQVVLSVNKDQATAAFTSAAPEVRQALEAALPRLREMMGEAGITLGNATVSSGAGQQAADQRAGNSDGNRGGSGRGGVAGDDDGAEVARTVTTRRLPSGAVDTFA